MDKDFLMVIFWPFLFQHAFKYFQMFTDSVQISACKFKFKGFLEESINASVLSSNSFTPRLAFICKKRIAAKLKRNCLIQDNISFTHRNPTNLFVVYELDTWSRGLNTGCRLGDCLFWTVKLIENDDLDKFVYSGNGVGFDTHSQFSFANEEWGKKLLFLELLIVLLWMMMIMGKNVSYILVKVQPMD